MQRQSETFPVNCWLCSPQASSIFHLSSFLIVKSATTVFELRWPIFLTTAHFLSETAETAWDEIGQILEPSISVVIVKSLSYERTSVLNQLLKPSSLKKISVPTPLHIILDTVCWHWSGCFSAFVECLVPVFGCKSTLQWCPAAGSSLYVATVTWESKSHPEKTD